jgi:hypothetical protein
MRKWNPYNVQVDDDWTKEFANKKRIPLWYSRVCLHFGLFLTNVIYLFQGDHEGINPEDVAKQIRDREDD